MMKIALLGITGRTGRLVAKAALDHGYAVSALARRPDTVDIKHEQLTVIEGDAHDADAVRRVVAGCDAVISTLGPAQNATYVCSTATKVLLSVMRELGIKRYIAVSGAGIDFPGDQKGFADKLISKLIRLFQPTVVEDKTAELELLQLEKAVEWVLVRPPRLVDGPPTSRVLVSSARPQSSKIRRSDLAGFLIAQLQSNENIHRAPFVSN